MPPTNRYLFQGIEQEKLLLVEGIEDARFFDAFLRKGLGKAEVQVAKVDGKGNFRRFISDTLVKADNFSSLRSLGVLRDADENPDRAFDSLQGALQDAGLPAPAQPWEPVESNGRTVSLGVLPGNGATGDLEQLCLQSIDNRNTLTCIENFIACMAQEDPPSRSPSKARLYSYLATRERPGLRVAEAAEAGIWNWEAAAFAQLRSFLKGL